MQKVSYAEYNLENRNMVSGTVEIELDSEGKLAFSVDGRPVSIYPQELHNLSFHMLSLGVLAAFAPTEPEAIAKIRIKFQQNLTVEMKRIADCKRHLEVIDAAAKIAREKQPVSVGG